MITITNYIGGGRTPVPGKNKYERRSSKRSYRKRSTCSSAVRSRLWENSLMLSTVMAWLLPSSVVPFSFPQSVVVPVGTRCGSAQCWPGGLFSLEARGSRRYTTTLGSTTDAKPLREELVDVSLSLEVETSVDEDNPDSINIIDIEDAPPERNVVTERNGVTEPKTKNGDIVTTSKLWKRRHARSIQEGIRREKTTQLSTLLNKAKTFAEEHSPTPVNGRRYAARTITGLINALAEEADGLEVEVDARPDTPLWGKHIEAVRIQFSRLGFKPLRISGLDRALQKLDTLPDSEKERLAQSLELSAVSCADEAFNRIDVDNSGALDPDEIASALNLAAATKSDEKLLDGLASQLVQLYDFNGDGVVDREEYQSMVEDMAALQRERAEREQDEAEREREREDRKNNRNGGWRGILKNAMRTVLGREKEEEEEKPVKGLNATESTLRKKVKNVPDDPAFADAVSHGEGSIVLSDLKLDLRRLLFGALPLIKKITPGGPLILEPFTMTITGSFNREDVLDSVLLDAGLRRLVARVLRRRIRTWRDFVDGALFHGRDWKMASDHAPLVEVPKLTDVEFDERDRMIVTGRALVRASPDSPSIEQAFKVRFTLGTRKDGQVIRILEPELALVIECPKAWERNIVETCKRLNVPIPTRPEPLYSFFPLPIVSPFRLEDKDGYDMGEDNHIKSIYIKDGALRFELSAVLRPGRFLGNHYLAFTVPQRTFIVTMDRVREGIRAARKSKREAAELRRRQTAEAYRNVVAHSLSSRQDLGNDLRFAEQPVKNGVNLIKNKDSQPPKGFFSRFVEGYLGAYSIDKEEADATERLTAAISDWFGRQGTSGDENFQE